MKLLIYIYIYYKKINIHGEKWILTHNIQIFKHNVNKIQLCDHNLDILL